MKGGAQILQAFNNIRYHLTHQQITNVRLKHKRLICAVVCAVVCALTDAKRPFKLVRVFSNVFQRRKSRRNLCRTVAFSVKLRR